MLPPPPHEDWYDPRKLYAEGYPAGLTSALQVFPLLGDRLRSIVADLDPEYALEVGPGNCPVLEPGPGTCYFDASHGLLRGLPGQRVEGDLVQAPFADAMFDLVLAVDVFSHIHPSNRPPALAEMLRIGLKAIIFNPEPDAEDYLSAPCPSEMLIQWLREQGASVNAWPVNVPSGGKIYRFGMILAQHRE